MIWDLGLWIADWSDFRRVTRNAKPVTEPTASNQKQVTRNQLHAHHLPPMSPLLCHLGTAVPPWMPNHGIQEPADAGDRSPAHHGRKRLPLFRGEKNEQSSAKLPE